MNNLDQEIHYRLLKILSSDGNLTQREMAARMGISLGKLNYCLAELVKKGFVKVNRFKDAENKLRYLYILTPSGLEAKAAITIRFLKRKMEEYELIRQEIRLLSKEIEEDNPEALSITGVVD
jgi:EPS-associated MarR family transcriptional regulator